VLLDEPAPDILGNPAQGERREGRPSGDRDAALGRAGEIEEEAAAFIKATREQAELHTARPPGVYVVAREPVERLQSEGVEDIHEHVLDVLGVPACGPRSAKSMAVRSRPES